jgi:hypothetical protein
MSIRVRTTPYRQLRPFRLNGFGDVCTILQNGMRVCGPSLAQQPTQVCTWVRGAPPKTCPKNAVCMAPLVKKCTKISIAAPAAPVAPVVPIAVQPVPVVAPGISLTDLSTWPWYLWAGALGGAYFLFVRK